MPDPQLKIMVSSTVHGFEDQVIQVCSTLKSFGYKVLSSHYKTIPVHPELSNTEVCLQAVENCDCFLGIITPRYGAVPDPALGLSITHQEIKRAIDLKKPCWFIAHRDISVARQLLKQYMYLADGTPNPDFKYIRTAILEDVRVIHMYNTAIKDAIAPKDRIGHWVDEYFRMDDLLTIIETQFADENRVKEVIEQIKRGMV
jgi:hypothetical protein